MRVLVRRAYSGWGYLASSEDDPGVVVHAVGFDEAVLELASKQVALSPDGSPLALEDLAMTLVHEEYGQYLLEVARRQVD
jgi:hypothetical protein